MGSAVLQGVDDADFQETHIQVAKRLDKSSIDMKGIALSVAKLKNTCFADLQGCRFANSLESRFQSAEQSCMGSAVLQGGDFLLLYISVFRLRHMHKLGSNC